MSSISEGAYDAAYSLKDEVNPTNFRQWNTKGGITVELRPSSTGHALHIVNAEHPTLVISPKFKDINDIYVESDVPLTLDISGLFKDVERIETLVVRGVSSVTLVISEELPPIDTCIVQGGGLAFLRFVNDNTLHLIEDIMGSNVTIEEIKSRRRILIHEGNVVKA